MNRSYTLVRPYAALGLFALSVALLGAHKTPGPLASPTPIPAFTASAPPIKAATPPTVVVYPFELTGEMPKNAGASIAQLFNRELTTGGLHVVTPPKDATRSTYLTTARADNADYYISGYLTPLGDGAAMVVQVVSTDDGIMIFSKTAQIFTTNDAAAQANTMRDVMLAHSGQLQTYDQPPPTATPQPASTDGASTSVGSLFGLFKHTTKSSGSNIAPAIAAQDKPDRVVIVSHINGSDVDATTLTGATQHLSWAMDRYFRTQVDSTNTADIADRANMICGSNRNATIAGGTLSRTKSQSTFVLRIYTCFGAVIYEGTAVTASNAQQAVERAVSDYALSNPTNS